MRFFAALFYLVIATQSAQSAEQVSAGDILSKESENSEIVNLYISGLTNGIAFSNAILEKRGQKRLYCPPENLPLGNKKYIQLLKLWVENSDVKRNYPAPLAIIYSLVDAFPCP